ncbi:hypothetical protein [Psychromicrobium sp. YIM B11713]|uniref:hypothetical protein n=1 Tax=Psychromicrobium sp. YIM B11713 TaxID=3145233 RepID=UPI00374F2FA2
MKSLGIEISPELASRQAGWFAPAHQPFLVSEKLAEHLEAAPLHEPLSAEDRDTFEIYGLPHGLVCILLSEQEFYTLERKVRTELVRSQLSFRSETVPSVRSAPTAVRERASQQADGHRFLWWPSLLEGHEESVLDAYLQYGRRSSRHAEVPKLIWQRADVVLPGARALAGTFPTASGPNCFGTVMGAAGVSGAADNWVIHEPFEEWLAESAVPGSRNGEQDHEPGTVLVWRSPNGLAQHAAVTIGGGYALHKPSQGWMSPRKILTVREVMLSSRQPGRLLQRYTLKRG